MAVITRPATADVDTDRTLLLAPLAGVTVFGVVSLAQAFTREGFDLLRFPLSMLATGDLAWLQITNFVVSGLLTIAGAAGLRRVTGAGWAPRLVALAGAGMVAAGLFTMDPGGGFPAGYDAVPTTLSRHAGLHLLAGSVSFLSSIAACFVLGRHLRRDGRRGLAVAVRIAGASLLVANVWAMSGGTAGSLAICIGSLAASGGVAAAALVQRAALAG